MSHEQETTQDIGTSVIFNLMQGVPDEEAENIWSRIRESSAAIETMIDNPASSTASLLGEGRRYQTLEILIRRLMLQINEQSEQIAALQEEIQSRPKYASSLQIHDLADERYQVILPISVIIEEYEDEVLITWPETNVFGYGSTLHEALVRIKRGIIEQFEDLTSRDQEILGEIALKDIATLKTYLKGK